MTQLAFGAVAVLILAPVVAGCLFTLISSFGWTEGANVPLWSLAPWRALLAEPGLAKSAALTIGSGMLSTLLALVAAIWITTAFHGPTILSVLLWSTPPLLAVPHLVSALGLTMVMAPSGISMRLVASVIGLERPPDWPIPQDPLGFGLTLGLACREVPFLLFVLAAANDRLALAPQLAAARALGRAPIAAWRQIALPQLYPRIRLPILAVLIYGLGNVDMALIMGPTAPAPLAVRLLHWFYDADLDLRPQAFAGATLLLMLTGIAVTVWRWLERRWLDVRDDGQGSGVEWRGYLLGWAAAIGVFTLLLMSLAVLVVWSVAGEWRFPAPWPSSFTTATWLAAMGSLPAPTATSLFLGLAATGLSTSLVLLLLEGDAMQGRAAHRTMVIVLWLPLVVPQIAFVFGAQVLWIRLGIGETATALLWGHLLMVLPYVRLTLAGPWERLDPRLAEAGRSLGHTAWAVWRRIKLPLLLRPILAAAAIGFAVSCAQYVVTLAASGGRFATLATETMALAGGGDRRRVGVAGLALALLPMLATLAALAIPAVLERRRVTTAAARTGSRCRPR